MPNGTTTSDGSGTASKRDTVQALREMHSGGTVPVERAMELASPWEIEDAIAAWSQDMKEKDVSNPTLMPVPLFLRYIVGRGIGDKPISADEYFFGNAARAIGGHKKSAQGEYKGNLAIIERDAGMEMTYGLADPSQNGTEPCPDCGRTCIYAQEDSNLLRCVNCNTELDR